MLLFQNSIEIETSGSEIHHCIKWLIGLIFLTTDVRHDVHQLIEFDGTRARLEKSVQETRELRAIDANATQTGGLDPLDRVSPYLFEMSLRRRRGFVTPFCEPANQTGSLVAPERESCIVRQEIAQPVFKPRATRIFLTQIKITGVISRSGYVTAKICDGSLQAVAPDVTQSRKQVGNDFVK